MNIRIIYSLFVFTIAFSAKPGFIVGFGAAEQVNIIKNFFGLSYYSTDISSEGLATDFKANPILKSVASPSLDISVE